MKWANRLQIFLSKAIAFGVVVCILCSCTGDYRSLQLSGTKPEWASCSISSPSTRHLNPNSTPNYTQRLPSSFSTAEADLKPGLPNEFKQFRVRESGLSLSVISSIVYGTSKRWPEIAQWNHLSSPFRIRVGQVLILKSVHSMSQSDIDKKLLGHWRNKLTQRETASRSHSLPQP